jgi:hypothetical protein
MVLLFVNAGYRIVLVEDVGELYPDISYKQRHSRGLPATTPEKTNKSVKDKKNDKEDASKSKEAEKEKADKGDAQETDKEEASKSSEAEKDKTAGTAALSSAASSGNISPDNAESAGGSEPVADGGKVAAAPEEATKVVAVDATEAGKTRESTEGEDGDEAAVNEQELAAHHMPDLIEGVQPMFVKGEEGKDAAAKEKAANGHAPEAITLSPASSDIASVAATSKESSVSATKEAVCEMKIFAICFAHTPVYPTVRRTYTSAIPRSSRHRRHACVCIQLFCRCI